VQPRAVPERPAPAPPPGDRHARQAELTTSTVPTPIRLAGFALVLLLVAATWLYLPSFAFSVVTLLH